MERVGLAERDVVEAVEGAELAQLASGERMSVQPYEIHPGTEIPEHSHPHEQCGYIFEGTLTFVVDGEAIEAGPGDSYTIPGDEPHAVENRGETTVRGVDIFSPPRPNPDWAE